jgi:hypothetical protein
LLSGIGAFDLAIAKAAIPAKGRTAKGAAGLANAPPLQCIRNEMLCAATIICNTGYVS